MEKEYISYLERLVFALMQKYDDFEKVQTEHANPDNSAGYFIPYNAKEYIRAKRLERGNIEL